MGNWKKQKVYYTNTLIVVYTKCFYCNDCSKRIRKVNKKIPMKPSLGCEKKVEREF